MTPGAMVRKTPTGKRGLRGSGCGSGMNKMEEGITADNLEIKTEEVRAKSPTKEQINFPLKTPLFLILSPRRGRRRNEKAGFFFALCLFLFANLIREDEIEIEIMSACPFSSSRIRRVHPTSSIVFEPECDFKADPLLRSSSTSKPLSRQSRLVAGLLGVESAQDAVIRMLLYQRAMLTVEPYNFSVAELTDSSFFDPLRPRNPLSRQLVSSRFARLQGIQCSLVGRILSMRFSCSTGDADEHGIKGRAERLGLPSKRFPGHGYHYQQLWSGSSP